MLVRFIQLKKSELGAINFLKNKNKRGITVINFAAYTTAAYQYKDISKITKLSRKRRFELSYEFGT